jgi:hypothetical protein
LARGSLKAGAGAIEAQYRHAVFPPGSHPLVCGLLRESPQMDTELQFDQVQQPAAACSACQSALRGSYFQAGGHMLCESCAGNVRNAFQDKSGGFGRLLKATALGVGGGLAGGAVYTAVLAIAHINAALVTILIGFLVGKGVSKGSGGRGGVGYQILAVLITYLAIGLSAMLAEVLTTDAAHGSIFKQVAICIIGAFIGPVVVATSSILGAVITFFGLLRAWQSNKAVQVQITGPHTLNPVAEPAAVNVPPLPTSMPGLPQSA